MFFYAVMIRHKAMRMKVRTQRRLKTRCFVRTNLAGCICGSIGGVTTCRVPQMGHVRTPSRSSVPQVLQIIDSSPESSVVFIIARQGKECDM